MLPKLQQSSLAQSLRRDNPATLVQSTFILTQPRINLKTLSENQITRHTSPGKINLLQKILIRPLVTSQLNTYPKRSFNKKGILQTNNSLFRVRYISMKDWGAMEEKLHPHCRKNISFNLLPQKVEHSKSETCLPLNFVVTMIEEISLFGLIIKVPYLN